MRIVPCVLFACGVSAASAAFKCVDAKGATHVGDTPPAECVNATTRPADPAEADQRRESQRAAAESKRRDRNLLDSYSSAREIELARDRNVSMIQARIEAADARARQLDERRKGLQNVVASYKTGDPPVTLRADLESVSREHAVVASARSRYVKELDETRARFEADRKRWVELREGK